MTFLSPNTHRWWNEEHYQIHPAKPVRKRMNRLTESIDTCPFAALPSVEREHHWADITPEISKAIGYIVQSEITTEREKWVGGFLSNFFFFPVTIISYSLAFGRQKIKCISVVYLWRCSGNFSKGCRKPLSQLCTIRTHLTSPSFLCILSLFLFNHFLSQTFWSVSLSHALYVLLPVYISAQRAWVEVAKLRDGSQIYPGCKVASFFLHHFRTLYFSGCHLFLIDESILHRAQIFFSSYQSLAMITDQPAFFFFFFIPHAMPTCRWNALSSSSLPHEPLLLLLHCKLSKVLQDDNWSYLIPVHRTGLKSCHSLRLTEQKTNIPFTYFWGRVEFGEAWLVD